MTRTRIPTTLSRSATEIAGRCMISRWRRAKRLAGLLSGMMWMSRSGISSMSRSVSELLLNSGRRDIPLRPSTIFVAPERRANSAI